MATKSLTFSPLGQVQDSIRRLQDGAEELLTQLRKEARKLVSKDRRKAIDDLVGQAKALPVDMQKSFRKARKTLETRAEKLVADVQTQAKKRIASLVSRLALPSKHEVELLAKRLSTLEKKVDEILSTTQGAA